MVSIHPLISKSTSSCSNPLVTVMRTAVTIDTRVTYIPSFFQFSSKVYVLICDQPEEESLLFGRFSFFVDYYWVWSTGQVQGIRFYIKILMNFVRFLFLDGFWVIIIIIIIFIRVFHISVSWWSFTGIWVTANLLKSPGLFPVFWLWLSLFCWVPYFHFNWWILNMNLNLKDVMSAAQYILYLNILSRNESSTVKYFDEREKEKSYSREK